MIKKLSKDFLIHSYIQAITLKLDSHFISLLEEEIQKRKLPLIKHEIGE